MHVTHCLLVALASVTRLLSAGESSESIFQEGVTLMTKAALGDAEKVAPAIKAFVDAGARYEKAANTSAVQAVNANLYWLRKQWTTEQINAFAADLENAPAAMKLGEVGRPIDVSEAKNYFDRAAAFAQEHPSDHLLIAIRYFEIAGRFALTPSGVEAGKRSSDAMSKVKIPVDVAEADYRRALTAANEEFEKAKKAAAEKLAVSLSAAQTDATRRGDLDLALKLRERLQKLNMPKPKTAQELGNYLDGTTWAISNVSTDTKVLYTYTFHKNGTLKHNDGRTGPLEFLGPRTFKLWNFDPAALNEDLNQFWAFGAHGQYFGRLQQ